VSAREIGRTLGVARSTIQDNLKRASAAGLAWPLAGDLTDGVLEQRLFDHAGVKRGFRRRAEPDWGSLACELKRPGVNLMVLWEEYRAVDPAGYGYSRFCDLFREFERRLSPTMRQDHPAGDKVFVDYSGKKIMIVDRATGVVREAEIFVAVLGASNYTYAEATWTQKLADWIEAHVRMFRFFGGVPRLDSRPETYTELRVAEPRPAGTSGGTDAPDPAPRGKADTGIKVGDSIVVCFLDDNKTTSFVLSRDRHDPVNGLVGAETPFGKQLLGSDEEDEIEVEAEGRSRRILIVRTARERVSLH
jgi:hypothetical protein